MTSFELPIQEKYSPTTNNVIFVDSAGAPVLPLNPSAGPVRPSYPSDGKPVGLYALWKSRRIMLTERADDTVDACFFDDELARCVVETNARSSIHWIDLDEGVPHPFQHEDPIFEADISDFGPLRYWLVPGTNLFLLPLRRALTDDLVEFKLAFCDSEGRMMGVLPMRPQTGSYQEDVTVHASAELIVVCFENELYVYRKVADTSGVADSQVVRLEHCQELDAQIRNIARDYVQHLVRNGIVEKSTLPSPYQKMNFKSDCEPDIPLARPAMAMVLLAEHLLVSAHEVSNRWLAYVFNWAIAQGKLDGVSRDGGYLHDTTIGMIDPAGNVVVKDGRFAVSCRGETTMMDFPALTDASSAIAFCNWLSEMEGLQPCYDIATFQLRAPEAGGYRLPTLDEWQRLFLNDRILNTQSAAISAANCDRENPANLSYGPYLSPVGYMGEPPYGIPGVADIIGNASEFVHSSTSESGSTDKTTSGIVAIGGDWMSCACADTPTAPRMSGFRLVRHRL